MNRVYNRTSRVMRPSYLRQMYRQISTRPRRGARPVASSAKAGTSLEGPMTWRTLAACAAVGTGGLVYYTRERERRMKEIIRPRTVGKAAIGGPFHLIDARGREFSEAGLLGRWTLIYFGFTMCPDICPEELTKIADALHAVEKRGHRVGPGKNAALSPIFITVDPERDNPQRADDYATNFHEAFIGLGGSAEQIADAAKQYRVYYSKDETPGDEYLVDHSVITYLIDPNGDFAEFFGKNTTAAEMSARIEAKMLAWK